MSIREKNEEIQVIMNPYLYEQMNSQEDLRVKMIFDRYRSGRSIILDDLQYLWLKDPEGCKKLARNIIESRTGSESKTVSSNINIDYINQNSENSTDQPDYMNYSSGLDTPTDTSDNIPGIMTSVKSIIEKMSKREQMDILKNLNGDLELKRLNNMKFWEDSFVDKMVMYTYVDEEKEINMLA
jgi:hypothetical protein